MRRRIREGQKTACAAALRLIALGILSAGCASSPSPEIMIHESDKGTVYLERFPDPSIQVAHPIKLDAGVIARVLRGVHVKDENTSFQALFSSQPQVVQVFSDEDAEFLAPLIATALSQAASDQMVGFQIIRIGAPSYSQRKGAAVGSSEPPLSLAPKETTAGTLYAYGLSLHVTLTQYRHRPERPDTINMPNRRLPDPTGFAHREVFFLPEAARRPDTYRAGDPDLTTLVVDYQLLAKLPVSQPAPAASSASHASPTATTSPAKPAGQAAPTAEELQSVKELIIKKDMELEALKEELRSLRRQLDEREAEPQKPKGKKKPVPQSQEASP